jgi:2,5-diketo-D-gluconate reductase B
LRAAMAVADIATVAHSPLIKARRMEIIDYVTLREGPNPAHTPAQTLLAWSMARGAVPLVRSRNDRHMRDNLAAADLELDPILLARLDSLESGLATHPQAVRDGRPFAG